MVPTDEPAREGEGCPRDPGRGVQDASVHSDLLFLSADSLQQEADRRDAPANQLLLGNWQAILTTSADRAAELLNPEKVSS